MRRCSAPVAFGRLIEQTEPRFLIFGNETFAGRNDPNHLAKKIFFDDLTPEHPDKRIVMETTADETAMRVVDMIVPIGREVIAAISLYEQPSSSRKTRISRKFGESCSSARVSRSRSLTEIASVSGVSFSRGTEASSNSSTSTQLRFFCNQV